MEKVRKSVNENGNEPLVRRYDRRSRGIGSNVSNLTEILSDSLSVHKASAICNCIKKARQEKWTNENSIFHAHTNTQTRCKDGQTHESRSFGKNVEPKQIEIRSVNGRVVENRVEVISGKS